MDVVALRRELHRIPELGLEERATSAVLRRVVGEYASARPIAGTGLVVDLGPPDASRRLLLRADMDGLPVTELTGLPFASTHPGRMHACGHDGHMAALAVAGSLLVEDLPPGIAVRLLFQPAEETGAGAPVCIAEGCLDGVDAAFGLHVWSELPVGTVAATIGGIMASVVEIRFRVNGLGGHGALPHLAVDPVVAAAQLVTALQTVVSRFSDPIEPLVLTLGSIHGGDAYNVVPETVELVGTVRVLNAAQGARVRQAISEVAAGISTATRAKIDFEWIQHTKATVNEAGFTEMVRVAAREVPGVTDVATDVRTMAGEDFGYILDEVPGCYAIVGARKHDGVAQPHHNPHFDFDEAALPISVELHRAVVRHFAANY